MARSVTDIRGAGTLRSKSSSPVGPADDFESAVPINSDGVVARVGNAGTPVQDILGDGRVWTPVQGFTPAALVAGQYFIENFGGVDYFVFVDGSGTPQRLRPITIIQADIAVPVGPAVALDMFLVDDTRYAVYDYTSYNPVTGEQEGGTIRIGHNGSNTTDATLTQIDNTVGVAFGAPSVTFAVMLSGVGVAQTWTLTATASAPDWAVAYTRQMEF